MRVSVLVENSGLEDRDDLSPEFGLSLHIENSGHTILFDCGTSGVFADNAEKMGIDLEAVDVAVLSHHHFDHGGGLARFLEINNDAKIYLRACPDHGHTFKAFGFLKRFIGIDVDLLERQADRFVLIEEPLEINPGVVLLTNLSGTHPRPKGNDYLWVERDGRLIHDPFDHELEMVIKEEDGMTVFTGCSHSGVLNMVDAAIARFPEEPVKAVFGGFHLIGNPLLKSMAGTRSEVEAIGREMLDRNITTVFSGHCTGEKAFSVLKSVMGETLQSFSTGSTAEV
ncbi:MAG: MBL fold metallo-hydrolase [Acidobacteria bacterium]|nr:MAG: MBL fold metallo-hydrolase [Acidobacteriota bacterium]